MLLQGYTISCKFAENFKIVLTIWDFDYIIYKIKCVPKDARKTIGKMVTALKMFALACVLKYIANCLKETRLLIRAF